MTSKATPGEWKAWKAPSGVWTVRTQYEDSQGRRNTAWPAVCNAGAQDNEANARMIAAAVNSYDLLTAQNEWLKDRLAYLQLPSNSPTPIEEWLVECGMPSAAKEISA